MSLRQKMASVAGVGAIAAGSLFTTVASAQADGVAPEFLKNGHTCVNASRTFNPTERTARGISNQISQGGFTLTNNNPDVDYVWVRGSDAGSYATGQYTKPNGVVEDFGPGHFPNQNGIIEYSSVSGIGAVNTSIPYNNGNGPLRGWGESNKIQHHRGGDGVNTLSFRAPNGQGQELFITLGDIGADDVGKQMHISINAPKLGVLADAVRRSFVVPITPDAYNPANETATIAVPLDGINARRVHVTLQSLNASHIWEGAQVGFVSCDHNRQEGDRDAPAAAPESPGGGTLGDTDNPDADTGQIGSDARDYLDIDEPVVASIGHSMERTFG